MTRHVRETIVSLLLAILFLIAFLGPVYGQGNIPLANLQQLAFIGIPNWTTANASIDLFTFNPVTKIMYFADRTNHGATAIDTTTFTFLGTIVPPNCEKLSRSCPSGLVIAPDLQKLVITSRSNVVFIYNLLVPGQSPDIVTVPDGIDEVDYDPLNHRVYAGNTVAPYFITVIDLTTDTLVGKIPLATSPEQPRFNPVDGLIYANTPDDDSPTHAGEAVLVIDPNQGTAGAIAASFKTSNCAPHAIDIDPVTDTALLGCSLTNSTSGMQLMDLRSGTVLNTFPTNGNDLGYFNPKLRRWYFGGGHNTTVNTPCPQDSARQFPVLSVFSDFPTPGQFVGVVCVGRNGNKVGVDPFRNNIYVATPQFPVNASSANTGQPGVLVFHDPAPLALPFSPSNQIAVAHVALSPVGSSGVSGTIDFTLRRRNMSVNDDGTVTGLPPGFAPTTLVVTTTVGNEVVNCGVDGQGTGYCDGSLLGDPLIGGVVDLASGVTLVASGKITLDITFPTFIAIE